MQLAQPLCPILDVFTKFLILVYQLLLLYLLLLAKFGKDLKVALQRTHCQFLVQVLFSTVFIVLPQVKLGHTLELGVAYRLVIFFCSWHWNCLTWSLLLLHYLLPCTTHSQLTLVETGRRVLFLNACLHIDI